MNDYTMSEWLHLTKLDATQARSHISTEMLVNLFTIILKYGGFNKITSVQDLQSCFEDCFANFKNANDTPIFMTPERLQKEKALYIERKKTIQYLDNPEFLQLSTVVVLKASATCAP